MADRAKVVANFVVPKDSSEYPMHGVFGGVTPQGWIAASFFSERSAIPQEIDLHIEVVPGTSRGGVPVEGERRGKEGFIRTVSATYYLDADMAESIGRWFIEKAAERRAIDG